MQRIHPAFFFLLTLCLGARNATAAGLPRPPAGFIISQIATIPGARELAIAPNGDLIAGTSGSDIYIVQNAEGHPAASRVLLHMNDAPAAGVAIVGDNTLYVGTQFGVWRFAYRSRPRGQLIARVRTSGISSDHVTTTVAVANGTLYASVGSSCNNCGTELDETRATVQKMDLDGTNRLAKALHIRNAIALAVNPATGTLWAGVAGQDELAHGHPYEIFDPLSLHDGVADYGWPYCYENRKAALAGHDCSHTVIPRVVLPAYDTPIGAVFYPTEARGRYVFPRSYWGGAFVTLHGSWHQPLVPPRVAFIPMRGDNPLRLVDWKNPDTQWTEFLGGFQHPDGTRIARPTGIAVGPQGDLFVADDDNGAIYRIRPVK